MILKPILNTADFSHVTQANIGVFAGQAWLSIYGEKLTLIGIYKDEQQLIGGFYFLKTKKFGLNFIKLPPYSPHCALAFSHENKNVASSLNFTKELMQAVCDYLESEKFSICVLAFPSSIRDMQPFFWKGYKVVPNYTYRIQLNQSVEQIVGNFDSKNRNAINKAIKENIQVIESNETNAALYRYFSQALHKAGANVYEQELKGIFTQFANADNSFVMQATLNDNVVGSVFCVYDEKACYYILAGIDKESKIQGINNLLVLKCIEKAKNLGCSIFDFEGSMLKGVERFFRSFGPELIPYYTINKANVFLEMALKFKKRSTF